jgi:hypothetical protein
VLSLLLDDSGSMQTGNGKRIKVLQETVHDIGEFVIELEESGLSLRFINFGQDKDGSFDSLTDLKTIDRKVAMGLNKGDTKLGTQLGQKIVNHIVRKAKVKQLKKPVIIAIITDGEVCLILQNSISVYSSQRKNLFLFHIFRASGVSIC